MTPYYQDSAVTLYHGDCREILPSWVSWLSFRLAIADPPYNSGLVYGDGTNDVRSDYWEWLAESVFPLRQLADVVLIKHSALKIADFLSRWPARVLVWSKPFSSGFPLNGIATHWEPVYWLQGKSSRWSKDVFECNNGNTNPESTTGHPAQFPERLATWLITTFSDTNEMVLDPFAGSGTTLRAAKDLGRRAIGIEIEERYCEIAAKRCSQEVLPFAGDTNPR